MKNKYVLKGDEVHIMLNRRSGNPIVTRISFSDFKKAMSFKGAWNAQYDKSIGGYYVVGNISKEDGKHSTVRLHTYLLDTPKGYQVDHINHDTLNNTRENLRVVTNAQNAQNRRGAYSNNESSKIRGVDWSKVKGMWRARVTINYKQHHLGYFDSVHDAKNAVVSFRREYMEYSQEEAV